MPPKTRSNKGEQVEKRSLQSTSETTTNNHDFMKLSKVSKNVINQVKIVIWNGRDKHTPEHDVFGDDLSNYDSEEGEDHEDSGYGIHDMDEYLRYRKRRPSNLSIDSNEMMAAYDGDKGNRVDLSCENVADGDKEFARLASIDAYIRDAFPSGSSARIVTLDVLKRINGKKDDDNVTYTCSTLLVEKYVDCINKRRTTFHKQIETWITSKYQWPVRDMPGESAYDDKEKYRYLVTDARFSRKNYRSSGAFLENTCLGDCVRFTLINTSSNTGPRLENIPDPIPRPVMALVHSAIMYRLSKLCDHELTKEEIGKNFSRGSRYHDTYKDIINSNSKIGRTICWDEVNEMIFSRLRCHGLQQTRFSVESMAGIKDDDNDDM
ncbi:hypothetical protein BDA99DRAFT_543385 [Phascolomyces articulosus]|uniref:DUF6532 domain-containing protein n=1 Tax=Phascolomyces articulosus TaxID=60185 RepID=A0AAD5P836_9FUNG|nr:hypothetical protein BDA99DRAFT_543385 [Phascolomyces articulosus]